MINWFHSSVWLCLLPPSRSSFDVVFKQKYFVRGKQSAGENKFFIKEPKALKFSFNFHWKNLTFSFGKMFDCLSEPNVNDLRLCFTIVEPLWILRISRTYCQSRSVDVPEEDLNTIHKNSFWVFFASWLPFTPFSHFHSKRKTKNRFKFYSSDFWSIFSVFGIFLLSRYD